MQMKNRRMLAAVLSAALLLSTCTTTNTWVYAQEESVGETETDLESGSISDPGETGEPSETGESSISGIKTEETQETETAAAEETETETESPETERQPQIANSWRYSNGELLVPNTYAVDDPNAWTKVDGFYVNNLGDPIKGAISRGIDVSSYQGSIDWEKVQADDVSFAIIRCGYGDNWEIDIDEDGIYDQDDRYWEINAAACERLGIPYGTYFYSYAMNEEMVRSEAEHTIRLLEGKNLSYPIYLDLEQAELKTLDPEVLAEHVQLYFEILAEAGYTNVGVYANKDWFDNVLTDPYFDTVNKWVAQYNEECTYEGDYSMWQATSTGRIDGITGNQGYVDINFEMNISYYQIEQFVSRLYNLVLDREPDQDGLDDWSQLLANQEITGAEALQGFVDSPEFQKKEMTDEEYIDIIYQVCLDRHADTAGLEAWKDCLDDGVTRDYILYGVAESNEFTEICASAGIERGNITLTDVRDQSISTTRYVYRCYDVFLGRKPDEEGLTAWISQILSNRNTPEKVAEGFVFSDELKKQNLSDEEFIRILYVGLFDRQADDEGLRDWMAWFEEGRTRMDVFYGFAGSDEFRELIAQFGFR